MKQLETPVSLQLVSLTGSLLPSENIDGVILRFRSTTTFLFVTQIDHLRRFKCFPAGGGVKIVI